MSRPSNGAGEGALPRAVLDTSSLVSSWSRRHLHEAVLAKQYVGIWSPWIIAELNRVLTWRWLTGTGGDLSERNRLRCAAAAREMMTILLPTFELAAPLPPYPLAWRTLADEWDIPIWAAAKSSGADCVVSENRRHYPPAGPDGRHVYEGVAFVSADLFLSRVIAGGT